MVWTRLFSRSIFVGGSALALGLLGAAGLAGPALANQKAGVVTLDPITGFDSENQATSAVIALQLIGNDAGTHFPKGSVFTVRKYTECVPVPGTTDCTTVDKFEILIEEPALLDPVLASVNPLGTNPLNAIIGTGIGLTGTDVVVSGTSDTDNGGLSAIRWSYKDGLKALPSLVNGGYSAGLGISSDASAIVGWASTAPQSIVAIHAAAWTDAGNTVTDLGSLAGPAGTSTAYAADADGGVVVGTSEMPNSSTVADHAFRWTAAGGMEDLGSLNPAYGPQTFGINSTIAYGVNADGSVVVGTSGVGTEFLDFDQSGVGGTVTTDPNQGVATVASHAFRWTQGGGMVDLGVLPGMVSSVATSVSADGNIVVGTANFGPVSPDRLLSGFDATPGEAAFRWTSATGMKDLAGLIATAGVDMTGITLETATSVTSDGQFIVGTGRFPGDPKDDVSYMARYCDAADQSACDAYNALVAGGGNSGGGGAGTTGITTTSSVQTSFDDLAGSHAAPPAHLSGTADLLLGLLDPTDDGNGGGAEAGVGSITLGAHGRYDAGDGVSLRGGLAFTSQDYDGVSIDDAILAAGTIRYTWPALGAHNAAAGRGGPTDLRPFAEAGGWVAPGMGLTFSRTYANGAGTATGIGSTTGTAGGIYAALGLDLLLDPETTAEVTASLSQNWLATAAYVEGSAGNPFPASFDAATTGATIVKATAAVTRRFGDRVTGTLALGAGRAFGSGAITGTVVGMGSVSASAPDFSFLEAGLRVGYQVSDNVTASGFALLTTGQGIGTHATIGAGIDVHF